MSTGRVGDRLPAWSRPLAVVAHPDDESFGLGAVLAAFVEQGARVSLLCLTHGEASTLHAARGELRRVRGAELSAAAAILGLAGVQLADHPDGALGQAGGVLVDELELAARTAGTDGLIAFHRSGVTGHPDHVAATAAVLQVAARLALPVLEWTLPRPVADELNLEFGTGFTGDEPDDIDLVLPVDRGRQCRAIAAHTSQATPASPLWRRLKLLGDREYLRLTS